MNLKGFRFTPPLRRVERALNQVVDAVNENRLAVGLGYRLKRTANGTSLDIQVPAAVAAEASPSVRFQIVTIAGDYLTCRRQSADGTVDANGAITSIAKPTFLRVTGVHGVTRDGWSYSVVAPANVRTLTNVSAAGISVGLTVVEELRPSYTIGDTIYASEPTGETGVLVDGNRLTWIDSNVDGRQYQHRRIMLDACVLVNNVPTQKTIVFSAGPIP